MVIGRLIKYTILGLAILSLLGFSTTSALWLWSLTDDELRTIELGIRKEKIPSRYLQPTYRDIATRVGVSPIGVFYEWNIPISCYPTGHDVHESTAGFHVSGFRDDTGSYWRRRSTLSFPLLLVAFALLPALTYIAAHGELKTRRHQRRGTCRRCNYSLRGLPDGRCPECGCYNPRPL